jgi:hypothetical protein
LLTTPRVLIWAGGSHFTFCGYGPLAAGTEAEIKEVTEELYHQAAEALIIRYRAECNVKGFRRARRARQVMQEIGLDRNQAESGITHQQNEVGYVRNEVTPRTRATRKKESAHAGPQQELRRETGLREWPSRWTSNGCALRQLTMNWPEKGNPKGPMLKGQTGKAKGSSRKNLTGPGAKAKRESSEEEDSEGERKEQETRAGLKARWGHQKASRGGAGLTNYGQSPRRGVGLPCGHDLCTK